jgi:hypothetical protein
MVGAPCPRLESRLVEFMAAQDRRAAHQDKCVSDMAKQVGPGVLNHEI